MKDLNTFNRLLYVAFTLGDIKQSGHTISDKVWKNFLKPPIKIKINSSKRD